MSGVKLQYSSTVQAGRVASLLSQGRRLVSRGGRLVQARWAGDSAAAAVGEAVLFMATDRGEYVILGPDRASGAASSLEARI